MCTHKCKVRAQTDTITLKGGVNMKRDKHLGIRMDSQLHIAEMARATIKMVTDSVDSFVRRDLALARAVQAYDDVVDALFNRVKKELVELIARDHANGEDCIDLLMIAKYFERIGDHAVNIAEWVEFAATGQHG